MLQDFSMTGSYGDTGYTVIAYTERGKIGFRKIEGWETRIRLEPDPSLVNEMTSLLNGWTAPVGKNIRFSIVISNRSQFESVLTQGLRAMKGTTLVINPESPVWIQRFIKKMDQPVPDERKIFRDATKHLYTRLIGRR